MQNGHEPNRPKVYPHLGRLGGASREKGQQWGIRGESLAVERIRRDIATFAPFDATVLIRGETGVGKELVARALHEAAYKNGNPFVAFNCCALPETLAEAELFGHVRGAFTGADRNRAGLIQAAENGTLLLDEIGDLPGSVQGKLLRFLEERRFRPVGSSSSRSANVRILAATNVDLEQAVEEGTFRKDLYYRLQVLHIDVPPLRERREDIPLLAHHLLNRLRRNNPLTPEGFHQDALHRMTRYDWPGNVREMDSVITRAALKTKTNQISAIDLNLKTQPASDNKVNLEPFEVRRHSYHTLKSRLLSQFEEIYLDLLLRSTCGYVVRAATLAQLDKKHLIAKLKKHGLCYRDYRHSPYEPAAPSFP